MSKKRFKRQTHSGQTTKAEALSGTTSGTVQSVKLETTPEPPEDEAINVFETEQNNELGAKPEFMAKAEETAVQGILGAKAMITTENMPGGTGIILVERSVPAPPPAHIYYRYDELGPQVRRVRLPRIQMGTSEHIITFETHKSYIALFDGAIAYVPQVVADFIQRENPGGMRLD